MFLFILQHFTSLKLYMARNQMIKAAVSAPSKMGILTNADNTSELLVTRDTWVILQVYQMKAWNSGCL